MTVITYRDGIMAADSFVSAGGLAVGQMQKMARTPRGFLVGVCGWAGYVPAAVAYAEAMDLERPAAPEWAGDSDVFALIVTPCGLVGQASAGQPWHTVKAPFYAMGSGCAVALGAMAAGADAARAAHIACEWDTSCRAPVYTLALQLELEHHGPNGRNRGGKRQR